MTPSKAAPPEGALSTVNGSTEVAQFSSALTHSARQNGPQWLIASGSRSLEVVLPDGTSLGVSVKVADANELQKNDFIAINAWINNDRKLIDHNGQSVHEEQQQQSKPRKPLEGLLRTDAFPLTMQCRPPKPRFKSSVEEPDDNSLGQRATRFAFACLDVQAINDARWTTEEKAALAWVQLYIIVTMLPAEEAFNVVLAQNSYTRSLIDALLETNLAAIHPTATNNESTDETAKLICFRSTFWQNSYPFHRAPWLYAAKSSTRVPIDATRAVPSLPLLHAPAHCFAPRRPRKPTPEDGPLYARHILELGQMLTFEAASSKDAGFVQLFTKWHNEERVANGWRQRGTAAEQKKYLESIEANPSTLGLVGKWDGAPWGYVELYWAKESNVSTFYDCDAYDRGFHVLVGEDRFRGPHRVRSWMGSVLHMLFTLDARTQRVILEPRASNQKMISYTTMCGGHVDKLIDLPHKRAALVICPRERFFQLCPLAPLAPSSSTTGTATGAASATATAAAATKTSNMTKA